MSFYSICRGELGAKEGRTATGPGRACSHPTPDSLLNPKARMKTAENPSPKMSGWLAPRSRTRLVVMAIAGVFVGTLSALLGAPHYAPLIGWDAAALCFSLWVWATVGGMNAAQTKVHAHREDPTRTVTDLLILTASVASLIGVGIVLVAASSSHGTEKGLLAGLAAASVALSWLLVHTLFTLRYARLYHSSHGGVDFNQDEPPRYVDFAYLAFTIGMTFQVSDTNIQISNIRATALRHALLSYLFGAVILGTTVNFIVGLS
jgi:uncharacterized membrane protein